MAKDKRTFYTYRAIEINGEETDRILHINLFSDGASFRYDDNPPIFINMDDLESLGYEIERNTEDYQ